MLVRSSLRMKFNSQNRSIVASLPFLGGFIAVCLTLLVSKNYFNTEFYTLIISLFICKVTQVFHLYCHHGHPF